VCIYQHSTSQSQKLTDKKSVLVSE
jgi:hypothetical protein